MFLVVTLDGWSVLHVEYSCLRTPDRQKTLCALRPDQPLDFLSRGRC